MSAETDLRALLAANGPIAALVGTRISADRIEQGAARPFIVFVRTATAREVGLDGTILGSKVTIEIQAWADTRMASSNVADAVQTCLESAYHFVIGRDSSSDPDLDLEVSSITVDWWE